MKKYLSFILIFLLFSGCQTLFKNYGSIVPHKGVTEIFESYQIDPNLNYYYSGSATFPSAIIGLHKDYRLDSDLWQKFEPTPEKLKELVTDMQKKALDMGSFQHGFAILDDKGKQIGVWYSLLFVTTAVKIVDDRTVVIITPPADVYRERGDDRGRDANLP